MLWCCVVLAFCGAVEQPDITAERVDLIEINHFHDENGKLVFDQVIFYDWSPFEGRYQVRAWRLLKANEQVPVRDWRTGCYSSVWYDGDVLRRITAAGFHETWTQYDPELAEREFLPKEKRLELTKLKAIAGPTNPTAVTAPAMLPPQPRRPIAWP